MKKTKNLKEYLKRPKGVSKVVEDGTARESICSTISEYPCRVDFYENPNLPSSDLDVVSDNLVDVQDRVTDVQDRDTDVQDRVNDVQDRVNDLDDIVTDVQDNVKDHNDGQVAKTTILDDRVNRVRQFTSLNIPLTGVETYLVLPKDYLRLSRIFKALLTVQKYDTTRKLTSIFVKARGSIERTLKTRVVDEDIKKLYFLLPEYLDLRSLRVEEKGEMVKTFTYKIECPSSLLDKRLMDFYREKGGVEIPQKEWEVQSGDAVGEAVVNIPMPSTTHEISTQKLDTPHLVEKATKRTNSILERIKEKERKRKEEFIQKMQMKNKERDLLKRIEILFKKESKRAIKLKEIVKILEIYDGINLIKKIVNEQTSVIFEIQKISGEDHLVYVFKK